MRVMNREEAIKHLTSRCYPEVAAEILNKQGFTTLQSRFRPTGRRCERCGKEVTVYWRESLYVYRQHAIVLKFEQSLCPYCGESMALDAKCASPHQKEIDAFRAEVDKKLDGVAREVGPHENRCGDVKSILREGDDAMGEPNENENEERKSAKDRFAGCLVDLLTRITRDTAEAMRIAGELMGGMLEIIHEECSGNGVMLESELETAERENVSDHHEVGEWEAWAVKMLGQSDVPLTNGELRARLTDKLCNVRVRALQGEINERIRDMDTMRQDLARSHNTLCRWRTWAGELLKLDDVGLWDEELRGRIVGLIEAGATPRDVEHAKQVCDLIGARVAWSEWARNRLHMTEGIVADSELRERLDARLDSQKDVDEHKRTVGRLREDLAQTNSHLATWQRWARSVLREGPVSFTDDEFRGRIATALWDRGYVSESERAKQIDELTKQIKKWRIWASDIIPDELILFADDDGWRRELDARIGAKS